MVELKRRLSALLICPSALDRIEQRREPIELFLRGALDHKLHAQAFVGAAHLQQRADLIVAHDAAVIVQKRRERVERAALAVIADVDALPRDDLHKPHFSSSTRPAEITGRLTPIRALISRAGGSWSPGTSSPEMIMASIFCTN